MKLCKIKRKEYSSIKIGDKNINPILFEYVGITECASKNKKREKSKIVKTQKQNQPTIKMCTEIFRMYLI